MPKTSVRVEVLPETLVDIQFVLPEHAADIKRLWNPEDFVDLGGGTKILQYQTIYKNKEKFYEVMRASCGTDGSPEAEAEIKALIDAAWELIEAAAMEESSLYGR